MLKDSVLIAIIGLLVIFLVLIVVFGFIKLIVKLYPEKKTKV